MTGMTPERLAAIEDRLPDMIRPGTTEHDALNLIDEVRRLRAGIEDIEVRADDYGQQTLVNMASALLNPTEGEDDG